MKISELYPEDVNAMQISFLPLEVFRVQSYRCLVAFCCCYNRFTPTWGCPPAWFCCFFLFFFPLRVLHRFEVEETALDKLKITFENSTDFFGRIVVYHLRVLGERL